MMLRRSGASVAARLAVGLSGFPIVFCILSGIAAPALAFDFTAEEERRILRHGPWPPPSRPDPSNRVSGKPAAIAFGRALFFDPRLSSSGAISCATCHPPDRAWTDGLPRSRGHRTVERNAPILFNLRFNRWFGCDGAQDTLWAQNLRPLLDRREMGAGPGGAARLVRSDRQLSCGYRRAFGVAPGADDARIFVDLGKALAAFLETQVTGRTPFDDFRDALARNDAAGRARYPAAAERGLRLFVGRGNCAFCHFGPAFTNGEFADAGVPHFVEPGRVIPADTAASASCAGARTPCWAASMTMRNAPPPPRPAMFACAKATSVSCGCRACATWRSPGPTCMPAASRRSPT